MSAPAYESTVRELRAAGCVFAEDEARLLIEAACTPGELAALVERRVAGVPLEHLLGWVEFCGLRIGVEPGVFVPRQRSELLVRQAVAVTRPGATVVDVACGCGALGLAVATLVGGIAPEATDIDPAAVRCAGRNLAAVGGRAYQGDLYDPLPAGLRGRVDTVVANVPYVPSDAVGLMPPEARLYEPRVALDGGVDGLDVLRRVAGEAPAWLAPGGYLFVETGEAQVPAALAAFREAGLDASAVTDEETGASVIAGHSPRGPRAASSENAR